MSPAGTVSWVAWRVTRAGEVEALVTRGAGAERRQERFGTLEAAEMRFGSGFGEVVRRALAGGSRAGRWRP
ncbi:MAG: hypothetical protein Q8W47_11125 [Candidatus Palauibacterales bacterium]|nr:hypothetical protein [Candidatus Palauibacterales bacterium]